MFEDHEMIRRAGTECMCNMMMSEEVRPVILLPLIDSFSLSLCLSLFLSLAISASATSMFFSNAALYHFSLLPFLQVPRVCFFQMRHYTTSLSCHFCKWREYVFFLFGVIQVDIGTDDMGQPAWPGGKALGW